jgi:putative peptidoglycan lipid II flippase
VADAFLVAFQLVNVVRRLLTEGALNAALVPAWLRLRDSRRRGGRGRLCRKAAGHRERGCWSRQPRCSRSPCRWSSPRWRRVCGSEALAMAVADAQLMLPYLAFAGP